LLAPDDDLYAENFMVQSTGLYQAPSLIEKTHCISNPENKMRNLKTGL